MSKWLDSCLPKATLLCYCRGKVIIDGLFWTSMDSDIVWVNAPFPIYVATKRVCLYSDADKLTTFTVIKIIEGESSKIWWGTEEIIWWRNFHLRIKYTNRMSNRSVLLSEAIIKCDLLPPHPDSLLHRNSTFRAALELHVDIDKHFHMTWWLLEEENPWFPI